jgi:hypothetical protein
MITKDIYGKTLSNNFYSSIDAYAQKVKPKVIITFLDGRHVDNLTITTNDTEYPSTSKGTHEDQMLGYGANLGYFFTPQQSINGIQRQAYTWAIANEKDSDGKIIRANGTWHAMPSDLDDEYEYGWRSNRKSTTTPYSSGGYQIESSPVYLEYSFDTRKVNKVRVTTSEFNGKIKCYRLSVSNNTLSEFFAIDGKMEDGEYFKDHIIPATPSNDVSIIRLTIYSTENPEDSARVHEVSPLYEVDVTDYIISCSLERQGELWENSIPIAGTGSSSASISLDNTTKIFNPFNQNSLYGKYMRKDLKINISNGWRIVKTDEMFLNTKLSANISSSSSSMTVEDASNLIINGNESSPFLLTLSKGKTNEEKVFCSSRTDRVISIVKRGAAGTSPSSHSVGDDVTFEPYEYINGGEFYVDEWTGGTELTVSVNCLDKTKFLTEKQITKGFYLQNSTVGDAIEKMLMSINVSKNELKQLKPYSAYSKQNAIASYSFSSPVQRDEVAINLNEGLRARIWKVASGRENEVKDIKADALDIVLSDYDKAMRAKPYIPQTYTSYSSVLTGGFNSDTNYAVDINNFSFDNNGVVETEYFNGVLDGYYIPPTSGERYFIITTVNSGVRMYIDDTVVIDRWNRTTKDSTVNTITSLDYMGRSIDLDAGVPYKIRLEFFHAENPAFSLQLKDSLTGLKLPISHFTTVVAEDEVGSRSATWVPSAKNRNHYKNSGVYIKDTSFVDIDEPSGIVSEPKNKSVKVNTGSSIRIPYDISLNILNPSSSNYTGEFSYELYAKFPTGAFSSAGTYIENETTSGGNNYGFTFFYNNSGNGFTIHSSNMNAIVVEEAPLDQDKWHHICVTYFDGVLKYYRDGVLRDQVVGIVPREIGNGKIEIKNSSKAFFVDEFAIYNKSLDESSIKDRYITTQIREITVFPHLYGNDQSSKAIIDAISLGDFGRFFVDEEDYFRYYHFYRFFEPSISQHSTIQKSISDETHIVSADFSVQLQTNKVTVSVTEQNPLITQRQGIWTATPDPSTLAVIDLTDDITSTANTIPVSSTDRPPFPSSGYLKIQDEVLKYSSIDSTHFLGVERGQFETAPSEHYLGDYARETRFYEIKFDNVPAFNIQSPLITAISETFPPQIELVRFKSTAYNAELVLAASTSVNLGEYAFIQGTNPLTEEVNFTAIAGTPIKKQDSSNLVKKQSATLSEDIKKYGLKEIVIENEYIYSATKAQEIADFLVEKFKDPVPVLNVVTMAIPTLQIGDRIRISSLRSLDIEDEDYWVVSHSLSVGDSLDHTITLRKVI